jgi:hypothetical protein
MLKGVALFSFQLVTPSNFCGSSATSVCSFSADERTSEMEGSTPNWSTDVFQILSFILYSFQVNFWNVQRGGMEIFRIDFWEHPESSLGNIQRAVSRHPDMGFGDI